MSSSLLDEVCPFYEARDRAELLHSFNAQTFKPFQMNRSHVCCKLFGLYLVYLLSKTMKQFDPNS